MSIITKLLTELDQEAKTTRKMLALVPEDKYDWKPHEKSMKMMPLATHLVEVFEWPNTILKTSELDFAKGDYKPTILSTRDDLMKKLEDDYQSAKTALENSTEDDLNPSWTIKNDGHELASWSKYGAIRHALNQITHHRAQLGVYYRLNNIPLPGSYGPSADQQSF